MQLVINKRYLISNITAMLICTWYQCKQIKKIKQTYKLIYPSLRISQQKIIFPYDDDIGIITIQQRKFIYQRAKCITWTDIIRLIDLVAIRFSH